MKTREREVKLQNRYTGDVVYTTDYNKSIVTEGVTFIRVYESNNPNRTFLVNRDAFVIVKD